MTDKGWYIKQLQNPPGIHFAVTFSNIDQMDNLLGDLKEVLKDLEAMNVTQIKEMGDCVGM